MALTPTNVLMTVASNGYLWAYTTDNKILTGVKSNGDIFYQEYLTDIDELTQFVVYTSTHQYLYYTTGSSNNVFVAEIVTPPLEPTVYISSSETTATLKFLCLSKDSSVLYQVYDNDNIYAFKDGVNSLALNYPGILSVYTEQDPLYPTALTVVTTGTVDPYGTRTINYTGPPMPAPVVIGSLINVAATSLLYNQLNSSPA